MAVLNLSAINMSADALSHFSFSDFSFTDFLGSARPLLLFIIGVTIYSIFIFKFYKFLARRDILKLKTDKYYDAYEGAAKKMLRSFFYVLENLVLIPLLVFFWFAVLAVLLLILSKNHDPNTILLTSAAIVAAVRITAYYNENLSQDLAKMIPFALLAVFLVDISYFSIADSITVAKQMVSMWKYLVYYLLFVTALEFVLRIVHAIATLFILKEVAKTKDELVEE